MKHVAYYMLSDTALRTAERRIPPVYAQPIMDLWCVTSGGKLTRICQDFSTMLFQSRKLFGKARQNLNSVLAEHEREASRTSYRPRFLRSLRFALTKGLRTAPCVVLVGMASGMLVRATEQER